MRGPVTTARKYLSVSWMLVSVLVTSICTANNHKEAFLPTSFTVPVGGSSKATHRSSNPYSNYKLTLVKDPSQPGSTSAITGSSSTALSLSLSPFLFPKRRNKTQQKQCAASSVLDKTRDNAPQRNKIRFLLRSLVQKARALLFAAAVALLPLQMLPLPASASASPEVQPAVVSRVVPNPYRNYQQQSTDQQQQVEPTQVESEIEPEGMTTQTESALAKTTSTPTTTAGTNNPPISSDMNMEKTASVSLKFTQSTTIARASPYPTTDSLGPSLLGSFEQEDIFGDVENNNDEPTSTMTTLDSSTVKLSRTITGGSSRSSTKSIASTNQRTKSGLVKIPIAIGVVAAGGVGTRAVVFAKKKEEDNDSGSDPVTSSSFTTTPSILNKTVAPNSSVLVSDDPLRKSQALQRAQETKRIAQDIRARVQEQRDKADVNGGQNASSKATTVDSTIFGQDDAANKRKAALEALDRIDAQLRDNQQRMQDKAKNRTAQIQALEEKQKERQRIYEEEERRRLAQASAAERDQEGLKESLQQQRQLQAQQQKEQKMAQERLHSDRIASIEETKRKQLRELEEGKVTGSIQQKDATASKEESVLSVEPSVEDSTITPAGDEPAMVTPKSVTPVEKREVALDLDETTTFTPEEEIDRKKNAEAAARALLKTRLLLEAKGKEIAEERQRKRNAEAAARALLQARLLLEEKEREVADETQRKINAEAAARALLKTRLLLEAKAREAKVRDIAEETQPTGNDDDAVRTKLNEATTRALLEERLWLEEKVREAYLAIHFTAPGEITLETSSSDAAEAAIRAELINEAALLGAHLLLEDKTREGSLDLSTGEELPPSLLSGHAISTTSTSSNHFEKKQKESEGSSYTDRNARNLLQARLEMRSQELAATNLSLVGRDHNDKEGSTGGDSSVSYTDRVAKDLLEARLATSMHSRKATITDGDKGTVSHSEVSAKYASINSLEERAFQILVDLGMVELHNDE